MLVMEQLGKMQRKQEQQKNFLTICELSNYLNIKEKTIYAKVVAGMIPYYRIGGIIRFRLNEIDRWLEGCRGGCIPEAEKIKVDKKRKTSSRTSDNHFNKTLRNIIDSETDKYYSGSYGKSDRSKGLRKKEVNNGSI